jgi:Mg-chelatase subunit ChlD
VSNNPTRTDSTIRMISVNGPDDMDDFEFAAARLLRRCRMILMSMEFSPLHRSRISDGMAGMPTRVAERDVPVFILRDVDMPSIQDTVEVWLASQDPGRRPGASGQMAIQRRIAYILEFAKGVGLSVTAEHLDESSDWPEVFHRNPRCLLIIMSRSDSTIMPAFDPEGRPLPTYAEAFAHAIRTSERLLGWTVAGIRAWIGEKGERNAPESSDRPSPAAAPGYSIGGTSAAYSYIGGSGVAGALGSPHQRPPDVPKSPRGEPLPHDGLFIRRNNAFGTRSTLGITDLIEQGVLIDQTQIRFDDFIASRSDGIQRPQAGEAVAVGHGYALAPSVAKAFPETTHFLEVALRAAAEPADGAPHGQPLPVNFVFVVDTSGSMTGQKLDIVKESIRQLYDQLRDDDILGVVSFDTNVRTVLRATRKADLPSDELMSIVYGLRADGGTDLNLGVLYGIDEIGRHSGERSDLVNCLYLFSDGEPTSGERNWITIRSNIAARLRGDLAISCFGFGADARIRELEALAGSAGGHFTFVNQAEDVKLNLREDLRRREHLAAINIQLQIEIDPEINIWHLYGHDLVTDPAVRASVIRGAGAARRKGKEEFGTEALPDLITEEKGIRIFAPDLAFGETYWIVFEVEVPGGSTPDSLGRARVQYVDTIARGNRRHDLALTPAGAILDSTVVAHAIGLWTSEITFYALDDLYQDDRATAQERLTRHANTLQALHRIMPVSQFRDDQVTVTKLVSLSGNLGRPMALRDSSLRGSGTTWDYGVYALNKFGRVRDGYKRLSFGP